MLKKYGLFGAIKLLWSLIYTRLFFPSARLIRLPFDIRNKKYIKIGQNFTTGFGCRIEAQPIDDKAGACIIIGDNVQINDYVHITGIKKVTIGNNVLLASKIYISDASHGSYAGNSFDSDPNVEPGKRSLFAKEVFIGDNVWLGEFVSVLPGVTIGKGSIVGANSVVTQSLPDFVIAVGAPAKPIKRYNFTLERWEKY